MTEGSIGGGRRLALWAGVVAAVALALTAVGGAVDPRRTLRGYHAAFAYWAGIAVASLMLLAIFHTVRARWMVAIRRVLEAVPTTILLFVLLFLPIALGAREIWPWADPQQAGYGAEALKLVAHRRAYLNVPFLLLRTAFYFAFWIAVSQLLRRWSIRQDREKGVALTARQRALGAGSLPFLALTITFAAVDWLESLDLHHASTIFGVYYFAGSFVSAVAVLILTLFLLRRQEVGKLLNADHWHSLGKLLFAFTVFWAYIAYSEYMLVWVANLPDEVPYFVHRTAHGWKALAVAVVVAQFLIPFAVLLGREPKRRPKLLAGVAVWVLLAHGLDIYFTAFGGLSPDSPMPHWTDLTSFVGIGAAAVAFAAWQLGRAPAIPVGDPYLESSMRYQPQ